MSLTAITAKMALFNPSVLIDRGIPRPSVVQSMRELQRDELYCPHCYREAGELIRVRFRNSEDRRPHFFHTDNLESGVECKNRKGESEKHNAAKVAIAESLKVHGLTNMSLDQRFLTSPEVTKRKPDVWVTYPNGATEAHEIQISAITSDVLAQRTHDLKQHGVASVHWYLHGKAYSRENRQWCHANSIPVFRLWFDGHDSCPRWTPDKPPNRDTVHLDKPKDRCASRSKKRSDFEVKSDLEPQPAPELPKPIEFCTLPFPVGSTVVLKCAPSFQYAVVAVETGVRTEIYPGENNPGHISHPKEQGAAQHYYTLRTKSGGASYWWHHQLELVRGD
jgi:hypothetical protein